jgi:hypothetical protein
MLRRIISRTHLARAEGKKVFPFGIYVRKDDPLPEIGEEVICVNQTNGMKFAGEVISVDEDHHTYNAAIDLSLEYEEVAA